MGMFDTVVFKCSRCGGRVELQSKAGDCILAEYSASEVPVAIAVDVQGESVKCDGCGTRMSLQPYASTLTVQMRPVIN